MGQEYDTTVRGCVLPEPRGTAVAGLPVVGITLDGISVETLVEMDLNDGYYVGIGPGSAIAPRARQKLAQVLLRVGAADAEVITALWAAGREAQEQVGETDNRFGTSDETLTATTPCM